MLLLAAKVYILFSKNIFSCFVIDLVILLCLRNLTPPNQTGLRLSFRYTVQKSFKKVLYSVANFFCNTMTQQIFTGYNTHPKHGLKGFQQEDFKLYSQTKGNTNQIFSVFTPTCYLVPDVIHYSVDAVGPADRLSRNNFKNTALPSAVHVKNPCFATDSL